METTTMHNLTLALVVPNSPQTLLDWYLGWPLTIAIGFAAACSRR